MISPLLNSSDLNYQQEEAGAAIKGVLQTCFPFGHLHSIVSRLSCKIDKDNLILVTKNNSDVDIIKSQLVERISDICSKIWPGLKVKITVICENSNVADDQIVMSLIPKIKKMDPVFTFSNFVSDESNSSAVFTMKNIVGVNERIVDPGSIVYLHGGVGVGKTHLLKATQFEAEKNGKNFLYISAEKFGSKYVSAVKENSLSEMRSSLLSYDGLLIDDLGFILHRKSTVEEMASIISIIADDGKDVVLATTINPMQTKSLPGRMAERISSALVLNIEKPSQRLKEMIANSIVASRNIPISIDLIDTICKASCSVRELKAAIDRISVYSAHNGGEITPGVIRLVLPDIIQSSNKSKNPLDTVLLAVSEYYNLDYRDLTKKTGSSSKVRKARGIAVLFCRDIYGMMHGQIAVSFGFSGHSSVVNLIKRTKKTILDDKILLREFEEIKEIIKINS